MTAGQGPRLPPSWPTFVEPAKPSESFKRQQINWEPIFKLKKNCRDKVIKLSRLVLASFGNTVLGDGYLTYLIC